MSTLSWMFKQIIESTAGRIRWTSNMWALVGSRWDKSRLRNVHFGEFVKDGRVLVKKLNTKCPHPPADDFYFDSKWWWVPATECRKCPHHRKSIRGRRYPICAFRGQEDKGKAVVQAAGVMGEIVQVAAQKAKDIIG